MIAKRIIYNGTEIYNRDKQGRFSSFSIKLGKLVKKSLFVMGAVSVIGWSIMAGSYLMPKTIYAEKEVITKVPLSFEEIPMLVKICKAESGNRQLNTSGRVLRGKVEPSDIGYCQINETIWNDKARELGYDIFTEKGNKDMAVWIYLNYGSQPWNASKAIWNK
jgi:hypothetical protein